MVHYIFAQSDGSYDPGDRYHLQQSIEEMEEDEDDDDNPYANVNLEDLASSLESGVFLPSLPTSSTSRTSSVSGTVCRRRHRGITECMDVSTILLTIFLVELKILQKLLNFL